MRRLVLLGVMGFSTASTACVARDIDEGPDKTPLCGDICRFIERCEPLRYEEENGLGPNCVPDCEVSDDWGQGGCAWAMADFLECISASTCEDYEALDRPAQIFEDRPCFVEQETFEWSCQVLPDGRYAIPPRNRPVR